MSSNAHTVIRLGLFVLITALFLFLSSDVLIDLHQRWTRWDESYSHGYLLVLYSISQVLLAVFNSGSKNTSATTLFFVLMSLAMALVWFVGYAVQVQVLQALALPGLIGSCMVLISGFSALRQCLIPVILLYLAVPIWDIMVTPLQTMTSVVADWLVKGLQLPIYVDQNSFTTPYGRVVVAQGCSGLAFFMMALTLALINAHMKQYRFITVIGTTVLFLALAVVTNWLRVTALIIIAYQSEMQHPMVQDHAMFGWWIFAGAFVVFLYLTRTVGQREPLRVQNKASETMGLPGALYLGLVAMVLGGVTLAAPVPAASEQIVSQNECWLPAYSGFDEKKCSTVIRNGMVWEVTTLTYHYQDNSKELVGGANRIADSDLIRLSEGRDRYQAVWIQEPGRSRVAVWSYRMGDRFAVSMGRAKLNQLMEYFKGNRKATLVIASVECHSGLCSNLYNDQGLGEIIGIIE